MSSNNSTSTINVDINMMSAIVEKVIQNGYTTTKPQKNLIVGWLNSLDLSAENIAKNANYKEDLIKAADYKVMVKILEIWLESQGKAISKPESAQVVSSVISKPVKKAPESVGFDHVRFYQIINKMVETKRLHGAKNARSAQEIELTLAYALPSTGEIESVNIKQTKLNGTAKDPGSIYINLNDEWCLNIGTEKTNHKITKRSDFDFSQYPWLDRFLAEFTTDPANVAAKSGHLTKRCCVCSLKLSAGESTSVGYGAKCAANLGWPYGKLIPQIASGEALLVEAVKAIESEKLEPVTEPTEVEPVTTDKDVIEGVKTMLKAYHANPMTSYAGLKHVALSVLPTLSKKAKGKEYVESLQDWLDSQSVEDVAPVVESIEPKDQATEAIESAQPEAITEPATEPEIRLTEQNDSVVTTSTEVEPSVDVVAPVTEPEETTHPVAKLSPESQAVLDAVKGSVSPERYAELYIQMLTLETQAVKPKKQRKANGTGAPKAKKDPSVLVNHIAQLCDIADSEGMAKAIEVAGKTDDKYMPRAYRSYREIYQQSAVIRELVDSGKLAWGSVHHYLAGRNPKRCGLGHLEDFATALSQGLWINTPTPVNPRPKPYNKNAGEQSPD